MSLSSYEKSIDLLRQAVTPDGFVASIQEVTNYRRIWTRDSVITGIASLLSGEEELVRCFRAGLETLYTHQHPAGFMPSNVEPGSGKTSYGGTVGRVDNVSWAVIGLCLYGLQTGDKEFLERFRPEAEKCLGLMDAWEFNGKGLIYVPQSGDWADEYIQHGYILYDQLLRVWALDLAAKAYAHSPYEAQSQSIRLVIQRNFWNNREHEGLYAANLAHQLERAPMNFWFLGFNPSRIYPQFDLQANALALFLHIGDASSERIVLTLVEELINSIGHMLPSFHPAIEENDWEMEELKNNYAYEFRNRPHEFHNGGLWAVWNGWMVAALSVHGLYSSAGKLLEHIRQANALNSDEFNECLHGKTLEPAGVRHCVWSAAGAIIGEQYLKGKRLAG